MGERLNFLKNQPKHVSKEQCFRLLLRLLRSEFPTRYPVKVRRVNKDVLKGSDAPYGICWLSNDDKPEGQRYFSIYINSKCDFTFQLDTILHEWAHALTWFQCKEHQMHGDIWARAYGKLYRKYIEE